MASKSAKNSDEALLVVEEATTDDNMATTVTPDDANREFDFEEAHVESGNEPDAVTTPETEEYIFDETYVGMADDDNDGAREDEKEEEKEEILDQWEEQIVAKEKAEEEENPYLYEEKLVEAKDEEAIPVVPEWEDEWDLDDVFTCFTKETRETPVGIVFEVHPERGPLVVRIKEEGVLAGTNLQPGMKLISFNGIRLDGMTLQQVIGLFRSASGECMIQSRLQLPFPDPEKAPDKVATSAKDKRDREEENEEPMYDFDEVFVEESDHDDEMKIVREPESEPEVELILDSIEC